MQTLSHVKKNHSNPKICLQGGFVCKNIKSRKQGEERLKLFNTDVSMAKNKPEHRSARKDMNKLASSVDAIDISEI